MSPAAHCMMSEYVTIIKSINFNKEILQKMLLNLDPPVIKIVSCLHESVFDLVLKGLLVVQRPYATCVV